MMTTRFDRQKEIELIKKIDVELILNDCNIAIEKRHKNTVILKVPWRTDNHPSLHYYIGKNGYWIWKDVARDETGSHIDFIMKVRNMGYVDAVRYLRETFIYNDTKENENKQEMQEQAPIPVLKEQNDEYNQIQIELIDEVGLTGRHRQALALERKFKIIPPAVKTFYVKINNEIAQDGYGIKDLNGNIVARIQNEDTYTMEKRNWKIHKEKDMTISVINPMKQAKVIIVEGLHDYIALYQIYKDEYGYIVLNSVNNTNKAIQYLNENSYIQVVVLALDNDNAGRHAVVKLVDGISGKDISILAYEGKDPDDAYRKNGLKHTIEPVDEPLKKNETFLGGMML